MICSFGTRSIFKLNTERFLGSIRHFCRLVSHCDGLFEYPSATLVYPFEKATQLITLSHDARASARRPGGSRQR